ncbi:MAG: stage II sporulation protein P [Clostridiales bacterium]|nr:stage II sporulation protein P [Clostridiales bacterium]
MRTRWKEYIVTILLWTALIFVTAYILFLLFPEQTKRWKQTAQEAVQNTARKVGANLQQYESRLMSYIYFNKIETSLFDPPIVVYLEQNTKANQVIQNEVNQNNSEDVSLRSSVPSMENQTDISVNSSADTPVNLSADTSAAAITGTTQVLSPKIENIVHAGTFLESQILDYNYLIQTFYIIDKNTSLPPDILNPAVLLSKNLTFQKDASKPQILIYHTHSQEAFADSVPGERSQTIVGMGDYLTELLTQTYGYQVIHHTGVYDMTDGKLDREPAYTKALPEITKILQENPSIEVVIDLHRDGVREDLHLVTTINGQPTAKIMLFNGVCRGVDADNPELPNNYRQDNLAFSLQLALLMKAQYPDLFRVIYTRPSRYNQHLCPKSALIECGAQTNTVQEVRNAMPILADLIHQILQP